MPSYTTIFIMAPDEASLTLWIFATMVTCGLMQCGVRCPEMQWQEGLQIICEGARGPDVCMYNSAGPVLKSSARSSWALWCSRSGEILYLPGASCAFHRPAQVLHFGQAPVSSLGGARARDTMELLWEVLHQVAHLFQLLYCAGLNPIQLLARLLQNSCESKKEIQACMKCTKCDIRSQFTLGPGDL